MNTFSRRLGVFLLLVVAAAGAARGQSYTSFADEWRRIVEGLRFSIGPFKIDPVLALRRVGYDSNIYYENEDVGDYTAVAALDVTAYLPIRRSLILYAREIPEYNFYLEQKSMRAFTNSWSAGLKWLLFNRVVLTGGYQSNEHQGPATIELGRPSRDTTEIVSAGLYYETARKTSFGLTAQSQRLSYRDAAAPDGTIGLSRILDRDERSVAGEVYYRVFTDSTLFFRGGATDYAFQDTGSGSRDSTSYQGSAGIRFPVLGPLRGLAAIGYKTLAPKDRSLASFGTLTANTELEARFGWFSLRATYLRDLQFSYYEDAFAFVSQRLGGGASLYPLSFLRLDYSFEVTNMDYPDLWAPPSALAPRAHRKDVQRLHSLGLVVRLMRTTGFGLTYNLSSWNSTIAGFNRDRHYVAAYLTQTF